MVKRKEVKIDEEQIRSMMTGDIPDAVLKNIWDDNDTGSPKEDGKEPETENRSGIPANPDEVKDTVTSAGEEATSPVSQATIRRKRNTLQVYPEHLFNNSVVKERRQTLCQQRELREGPHPTFRDCADCQHLLLHRQYPLCPSGTVP